MNFRTASILGSAAMGSSGEWEKDVNYNLIGFDLH
jgi:hypothetical protein